ncbi:hypothetical protein CYMTET_24565 [Cymbomonas tetramitiformis]|uniref:DNA methylase N-4/N-6 domain-containing protein n=1 Tax=Cymbomonas tetramitiformis TaxID=36881 RepID=A0AAE0FVX2_9CHLO|nr:hypothetical protein CYMTET_24565 [Cymbomonas tetramitiformis]
MLTDVIHRHMRGPESPDCGNGHFPEEYEGVIPVDYPKKEFHWILDACCGSGSTSVAANKLGMVSIAFDKDPGMVISTRQRIMTPDLFYDEVDESLSKEQYNAEREQEAKEQKELEKESAERRKDAAKAQKKLEKGKARAT